MDFKGYKRLIFMLFGFGIFAYLVFTEQEVPEVITHMIAVVLGYLFGGDKND